MTKTPIPCPLDISPTRHYGEKQMLSAGYTPKRVQELRDAYAEYSRAMQLGAIEAKQHKRP